MTDNDRVARHLELLNHTKAELVLMVRRHWVDGVTPPERWTKAELAADVADWEYFKDAYQAYGRKLLTNHVPDVADHPHCGGTGCTGHDTVYPWEDVRERYQHKRPCVSLAPPTDELSGIAAAVAALTQGWCYRIDAVPMPTDRMISYGTRDTLPAPTLREWADALAAHCRIERPEYRDRPIRVMVWRNRGHAEHYRAAPPPSPLSTTFAFRPHIPDRHTHQCTECAA